MSVGKRNRMQRIFRSNGRAIIVPVDHGLTLGPIPGLNRLEFLMDEFAQSPLDGFLSQKGILKAGLFQGKAAQILHLAGATKLSGNSDRKVLVGQVEDALRWGLDAVSVHVSIGSPHEHEMLQDLGAISSECDQWGIPLLAMMYLSPEAQNRLAEPSNASVGIAHIARVAAEAGADMVKVPYTGSVETFQEVVDGTFIPVLAAGGETCKDEEAYLKLLNEALHAGASGLCIGRNVFQNRSPRALLEAIEQLVHFGKSPSQAFEHYVQTIQKQGHLEIRSEVIV